MTPAGKSGNVKGFWEVLFWFWVFLRDVYTVVFYAYCIISQLQIKKIPKKLYYRGKLCNTANNKNKKNLSYKVSQV